MILDAMELKFRVCIRKTSACLGRLGLIGVNGFVGAEKLDKKVKVLLAQEMSNRLKVHRAKTTRSRSCETRKGATRVCLDPLG